MSQTLTFLSSTHAEAGIQHPWRSKAQDLEVNVDIPPEFSGQGHGFSPEDLYAIALQNCFVATFKVIADKSKLIFSSIDVDCRLELEEALMKRVYFTITLNGVANEERALRLLEKTSKSCMILNSVKSELFFTFSVHP